MITLKLATYTQQEIDLLAQLLKSLQPTLHTFCITNLDCKSCPIRHLCFDVAQSTMYAEECESICKKEVKL